MEFLYLTIFGKSVRDSQISLKSDQNYGTSHEEQHTFLIISR